MDEHDERLERDMLLRAIAEGFEVAAWHGPNLKDSLQRLGPDEAVWRPGRDRHNIQEIVVHAAFWKHAVRNRITGVEEPFSEEGSDWFERTLCSEASLRSDLETLERAHRALCQAVESLPRGKMDELVSPDQGSVRQNVLGVAFHDVYHAGQIQLLRKLHGKDGSR